MKRTVTSTVFNSEECAAIKIAASQARDKGERQKVHNYRRNFAFPVVSEPKIVFQLYLITFV